MSVITYVLEDGPRGTWISERNQLQKIRYKTVRESKNGIVSLRCASNCNPPCGIYWYKDGTLLPGERKEVLNIPRNRKDSGYYMCRANGEEGSQNSTNTVKVTVECKSLSKEIRKQNQVLH